MTYAIYEGNMERLEKKMNRIANKAEKYGCEFRFEQVGEEYQTLKREDGYEYTARFVLVEAEGIAKVNGWKFIGTVEHTESGNIIRKAVDDVEVPERYYNSKPICEHCNSKRRRKDTYIVMNEETGEFKQVGKTCLKDFTKGMDANLIAQYMSFFEDLIQGETPMQGSGWKEYFETAKVLRYIAESIRNWGYVRADADEATKHVAYETLIADEGGMVFDARHTRYVLDRMQEVGFDANNVDSIKKAQKAVEWLETVEDNNNYMHNLKTALSLKYVERKHFGILASLFPTYEKAMGYEKKKNEWKAQHEKEVAESAWVGEIGDRITIKIAEATVLTGWETQWGYTRIWKIVDEEGRTYTWKTGNWIDSCATEMKATVKDHNEYRGVKQTELTRCKVTKFAKGIA